MLGWLLQPRCATPRARGPWSGRKTLKVSLLGFVCPVCSFRLTAPRTLGSLSSPFYQAQHSTLAAGQSRYDLAAKGDFGLLSFRSWILTFGLTNPNKLTRKTGPGGSLGRDAWLLDSNVRVEDGNLVLVSHRQPYNGSNFTSGAVVSQNKAFFQYGRVCVRAKLPGSPKANASTGIWPGKNGAS